MSWGVFLIAAWLALGVRMGLAGCGGGTGPTAIAPSFVLVLAVFVAMWAPSVHALFGCVVLGLGLDLLMQLNAGEGMRVVVGPNALGFLLMGYAVVISRSLVFRRNIQSGVFLTLLGGLLVAIVATGASGGARAVRRYRGRAAGRAAGDGVRERGGVGGVGGGDDSGADAVVGRVRVQKAAGTKVWDAAVARVEYGGTTLIRR